MNLKKFLINILFITFTFTSIANENVLKDQNTEFSVYTGMFDFSDNGKKSTLIGFQHQNENLNRDTFLGNLSPITGALITADNAGYIYTGIQAQYKLYKRPYRDDAITLIQSDDLRHIGVEWKK